MSEKYGRCKLCKGWGTLVLAADSDKTIECGACGGTGFDGSARAYEQMLADKDWKESNSVTLGGEILR